MFFLGFPVFGNRLVGEQDLRVRWAGVAKLVLRGSILQIARQTPQLAAADVVGAVFLTHHLKVHSSALSKHREEPTATYGAAEVPSPRAAWGGGCSPPGSARRRPGTGAKTSTRPGSRPARRAEASPGRRSASPAWSGTSSTALEHTHSHS